MLMLSGQSGSGSAIFFSLSTLIISECRLFTRLVWMFILSLPGGWTAACHSVSLSETKKACCKPHHSLHVSSRGFSCLEQPQHMYVACCTSS
jgi:hypothetical protein